MTRRNRGIICVTSAATTVAVFSILAMALYGRPVSDARADAPPPPPMTGLGQLDGTTWVKHDNARHVTCWVYSYSQDVGTGSARAEGGISCLPDSVLGERGTP